MPMTLEKLLESIPEDAKNQVQTTLDETRRALRDALREECRLMFRIPKEAEAKKPGAYVPIHIEPGRPEALKNISFSGETAVIVLLSRYKNRLELTHRGINKDAGLIKLKKELSYLPNLDQLLPEINPDLESTLLWTEKLLDILKGEDPLKKIFAVNEDILGVYEYELLVGPIDGREVNRACIRLYWAVIGLVSEWLGCTVKDLTIVVLTHELAHAYTQLGADIEGRRWASVAFAKAETEIKEGLAQYYTDKVLRRLSHKYPEAYTAFRNLSQKQPYPYRIHKEWVEKFTPEVVRRAMLEMRRQNDTKLREFNARLNDARRELEPRL